MAYLYALLGIAMVSGISTMFTINNLINSRFNLSSFLEDNYINSNIPKYDKQILAKFYLPSVPDNNICSYIINSTTFPEYEPGVETPTENSYLFPSCSIVSKSSKHRVIINTENEKNKKYKLFSCIIGNGISFEDSQYCKFEMDN